MRASRPRGRGGQSQVQERAGSSVGCGSPAAPQVSSPHQHHPEASGHEPGCHWWLRWELCGHLLPFGACGPLGSGLPEDHVGCWELLLCFRCFHAHLPSRAQVLLGTLLTLNEKGSTLDPSPNLKVWPIKRHSSCLSDGSWHVAQ